MSIKKAVFGNLRNVHITQFGIPIFLKEDVSAFKVPVENIKVMKAFKSQYNLGENLPNTSLVEDSAIFLVSHYFLIEISVIEKLHYNTERVGFDERMFVADDVGRVQRGKDPHLI